MPNVSYTQPLAASVDNTVQKVPQHFALIKSKTPTSPK